MAATTLTIAVIFTFGFPVIVSTPFFVLKAQAVSVFVAVLVTLRL